MKWIQKEIFVSRKSRGFHIITYKILDSIPELKDIKIGIANVFIQHTSASLTLNENADPDVRSDFVPSPRDNKMVPEDKNYYKHTSEGLDDMTSHIKASLLGNNLTIPITNGELNLGRWQGVYLCEHRNNGGKRKIVITLLGV